MPAGGDLQKAIDAVQPGDAVTLKPGAVFTGNFVLPKKSGNAFVTITPQAASSLAKIAAPNDSPANYAC